VGEVQARGNEDHHGGLFRAGVGGGRRGGELKEIVSKLSDGSRATLKRLKSNPNYISKREWLDLTVRFIFYELPDKQRCHFITTNQLAIANIDFALR